MQDIDFDLAGARKAGAKPAQLSSYFKSNFNLDFDFDGAYKAGATDNQILSYLNQSYSDLKKKGNSGVESGVKSSPTPSKLPLEESVSYKNLARDARFERGKNIAEQGFLMPYATPEQEPKEQGWLLNTVSALDKGFAKNLVSSPVRGLGVLLQGATKKVLGGTGEGAISNTLAKFGDYFDKAIDEITPQDEAYKNSLSDQFGQAFGQVASLIATGGITGATGKAGQAAELAAQIAPKGAGAATALKTLSSELSAPTAVSAGLSMGQAEFDRAKQAGATDDQAFEAFYKNAAVGSVLETIPVMQFFKRFEKATAGGVANYLKTKGAAGLTGGIEEMTTEVLQQLYSNKTAKDIYNINQDIFDGVGSSGGVGFGVGFLLNAMGANAKILRKQGKIGDAKSIENQIKQFETKLETPASIKVLSTQIANQGGGQNVIANLNQDLANNVITPQEHQEGVDFAQKADAVAPKIPENISPDNKAKSIELLVERNDIKENNEILLQQKQASDEAYHAGINEQIKANDEKIKKINDEVFKIAKEPIVEEVEQTIVEEPAEVVEEQAVVEKPKLADKLSTFKEKYTLISEGAAKAIETKKINQQAGKIVPMNTEAAVLAWLSGNNELSWKAINDAAGRREQARLNVGKDYSTEEVKVRDYSAKKRNGGVGLRDAAHQIWQDLTKRTGDKNITTKDVESALLNAIRENPTRIDAAKNLINIAGAEEAPISIEEGVEDFYSRKGEQPTEPVVEQGMPEGGFVPFQEGEEEIPFSVQEIPTDEVNDMKEIVKDLVEEGLNLNAIRNRIAKELGYDSKRLKETVNKAYQEYTKEFTPKEVTKGIIGRIGGFISDLFGGKAEDKVVILKDAQSTFAKASQLEQDVRFQIEAGFRGENNMPIAYRYDTNQVARERFDIPKLKKIGEGSDRVVFDLKDGKVLKVAKTPRGLEQNIYEGDYYLSGTILPETFERGLNYVVVEKISPAITRTIDLGIADINIESDKKGIGKLNDLLKKLKQFTQKDFDNHNVDLQAILTEYDLTDIMNYDVIWNDFTAKRNWGLKNGEPLHLDGGTFGGIQMLDRFKGQKPLSDPEFRDIYNRSKKVKIENKDVDKFIKFMVTPIKENKRLAPNGKPSNLNAKQYEQVRTKEFKDWFGDWENDPQNASKVVDENGEPLVVYHGSVSKDIELFDRSLSKRESSGLREMGFYFTTNKKLAEAYMEKATPKEGVEGVEGKIYESFLNLRKVKEFDADGKHGIRAWDNLQVDAGYKIAQNRDAMDFLMNGKFGVEKVDGIIANNIVDIELYGYKGQQLKGEFEGTVYLVFDNKANSIKSATENIGEFSTTDDRINYMAKPNDEILGFTYGNKIYLNGESLNPNTPIHEAGHIWTEWVKQFDNKVYQRGIELVKNSDYLKEVKSSKFYQEQAKKLATKEEAELYFQHEALAMAIGDKGAQFVTESKRTSFKEWLDTLWTKIRDLAGFKDITAEELQNVTFEEFTKMAVKDILGKQFEGRTLQEIYETLPMGKKLRQNKEEILIRDNFDNIVAELIKNNKIEKIC